MHTGIAVISNVETCRIFARHLLANHGMLIAPCIGPGVSMRPFQSLPCDGFSRLVFMIACVPLRGEGPPQGP
jgi:hypothetical protein